MANRYDFTGRVALVTGGASGIGAATAELLQAGGADVHIFDLANGEDVRDSAQLDAAVARLSRLDVLVCAAGIVGDSLHTDDVSDEEWGRVHAINLNGVFYANRAAIPKMKAGGYGRIVNVASIAGKEGNPNAAAYSASKAGAIGLTKSLGKELATYDIAVNAITPAVAKTAILDTVTQQHIDYMLSKIPRGRLVRVDEIAATIAFMVSEECSFTTGFTFDITGGRATY